MTIWIIYIVQLSASYASRTQTGMRIKTMCCQMPVKQFSCWQLSNIWKKIAPCRLTSDAENTVTKLCVLLTSWHHKTAYFYRLIIMCTISLIWYLSYKDLRCILENSQSKTDTKSVHGIAASVGCPSKVVLCEIISTENDFCHHVEHGLKFD